ncbi:unnamed protein product [Leptosia nina]|uniref:PHD and RING finger domain-containing protein 1 n=1 Tax=Leptosia nina TaxID=320188 RepID=A0AAV1IXI7_9NEOP
MNEEGTDESPPRSKRKIKRVMIVSSTSGSDSDESISMIRTRRKKLRVVSDNDGSDSSGSSIVCGLRRRRAVPKLCDSEHDSDSSTIVSDSQRESPSTSKHKSGCASDSSDGNSEKCAICLLRFLDQEIGTPINCEHIFCLDCITEWSKNVNTCPVDRITFDSVVVRACMGGRIIRTEAVKVVERRPSIEILLTTVCEICQRGDNEESLLLCDGCDLGYHMHCLTPPLSELPATEALWLCPNCVDNIVLQDSYDEPTSSININSSTRRVRDVLQTTRTTTNNQAGTSRSRNENRLNTEVVPTTSGGIRASNRSQPATKRTRKRKRTSNRSKKVIIEYEIVENGKFPITRRVTRTVRKRKGRKRQPRTAARRNHVQKSVRERLASLRMGQSSGISFNTGLSELSIRRERAAIPTLSIYGNNHQLEYFTDDEVDISEGASTVTASRHTSSILSAFRQARRKMITIPSPPHATSAPDILSNILECQTLLHSKKSVVSVSIDGDVSITLQKSKSTSQKKQETQKENKVDLSKSDDCAKKVPSYPGQSRGGGGWGGGYRGSYHRDQGTNNYNRGNYDNNYGNSYQGRTPGNNVFNNNYQNNVRRDSEPEFFENFPRRPPQFPPNEDPYFDRQRRNLQNDSNRPNNYSNVPRHPESGQGRFSTGSSWPSYNSAPTRQDVPLTARHSFGGFENPVDMRMGQMPPRPTGVSSFTRVEPPQQEKSQHLYNKPMEPQPYQALPQPPVFNYPKTGEQEKSEDEKSDTGLIIDTEKYDPTEPTNDDDSGDDDKYSAATPTGSNLKSSDATDQEPIINTLLPSSLPASKSVQSILAGIDTSNLNVPANVLDTAVRQVLQEHRNLIGSPLPAHEDKSDEESEGDCPNFSIYSATSVHIANNTSTLTEEIEQTRPQHNSMEDLVQEDDDIPTPETASPIKLDSEITPEEPLRRNDTVASTPKSVVHETSSKSKIEEEYKEKISKRCPITTNTRNPIKIKLNTPSLIKRVTLYDEEDVNLDINNQNDTASHDKVELHKSTSSKKENDKLNSEEIDNATERKLSENGCDIKEKSREVCENAAVLSEHNNTIQNDINKESIVSKGDADHEDLRDNTSAADEEQSNDSDHVNTEVSDSEICLSSQQSGGNNNEMQNKDDEENVEKMTESISETEDERSYTPCLDENKPKDILFETEKDKALEGLDTEMISEEEGNEMFSENERAPSVQSLPPPPEPKEVEPPPPEHVEKKKSDKKRSEVREEGKKKKKKDSKKEGKDKSKSKKKSDTTFKKLSKSGKERNYRERDKDDKRKKERRSSSEPPESKKRRKEKRKDLERYDVRTVVTEKRRKVKDPFGRDISPPSPSPGPTPAPRRSVSPPELRRRRSVSRARRSISRARRSVSRARRSISRARRSVSPLRSRRTPSRPRRSPIRRSISRASPVALRDSPRHRSSGRPGRSSLPRRLRRSISHRSQTPRLSPRRSPSARRRSPARKRRRRSASRARRRRSASASPKRTNKKKKRTRSERSPSRRRVEKSPPKKARSRSLDLSPAKHIPSPSIDSQLLSPRTPPPESQDEMPIRPPSEEMIRRRRRDPDRQRRRLREIPGPSKEVFTSGDNILVSVSFKDQERGDESERRRRRESKRERRRRRCNNAPVTVAETVKPVAIIDLERSPFRELTPSPKNVIVLSDSEPGERDAAEPESQPPASAPTPSMTGPEQPFLTSGPKTPPEPSIDASGSIVSCGPPVATVAATPAPTGDRSPCTAPQPEPQSPDAYDPFEPTRSASGSPGSCRSQTSNGPPTTPPRTLITLEAAQRTNMSADEVLDRRPLSPAEKVLALLQSTRDASPEPVAGDGAETNVGVAASAPVGSAAPRIVLPSPTRTQPKLFPGKPSPIKSNPVKPMQALRPPSDTGASPYSPYSPGSSDFGDLFEPRDSFEAILRGRRNKNSAAKVPVKLNKKKGKMQIGVKVDEENLKILDELPSSAVEMQVKSKFLKKLNRQERVVEEVKLVLKPHYNKKHVTKEEYKHILRRAVPKICHNKTGEINPAKIQSLVEAYVKKFRKKRKLGLP